MKSGIKSSEFYVTLGSTIVSLLVMSGVLSAEQSSETAELIAQAIAGIVALGTIVSYIYSRTALKAKEMEKDIKG